jgi:hypothetical protein
MGSTSARKQGTTHWHASKVHARQGRPVHAESVNIRVSMRDTMRHARRRAEHHAREPAYAPHRGAPQDGTPQRRASQRAAPLRGEYNYTQ